MEVTGPVGPDYILQANGILPESNWSSISTNTPASSPLNVTDTNLAASAIASTG